MICVSYHLGDNILHRVKIVFSVLNDNLETDRTCYLQDTRLNYHPPWWISYTCFIDKGSL